MCRTLRDGRKIEQISFSLTGSESIYLDKQYKYIKEIRLTEYMVENPLPSYPIIYLHFSNLQSETRTRSKTVFNMTTNTIMEPIVLIGSNHKIYHSGRTIVNCETIDTSLASFEIQVLDNQMNILPIGTLSPVHFMLEIISLPEYKVIDKERIRNDLELASGEQILNSGLQDDYRNVPTKLYNPFNLNNHSTTRKNFKF